VEGAQFSPPGESPRDRSQEAFEKGLAALRRRERGTAELAAWLGEREFATADVNTAIARLTEVGELDDRRFASRFAEDKRELRGWGPDRIREALSARRIPRELIEAALAADSHDEQLTRAQTLLERRGEAIDGDAPRARALSYLTRRGYDLELAYEAVRRAERDAEGGREAA
jgi:regulatory protein